MAKITVKQHFNIIIHNTNVTVGTQGTQGEDPNAETPEPGCRIIVHRCLLKSSYDVQAGTNAGAKLRDGEITRTDTYHEQ